MSRATARGQRARNKPKTAARKTQSAIVAVPATPRLPWELNQGQIALLKNYLHMGDASEMEVQAGLEVARRYRLDPFKQGQIWFIKRWDSAADNGQGGRGAFVRVPQVGIYGLLHIASRDYSDFGSLSEPEYGPMFQMDVEGHKFKAPEWCRVKAFKKNVGEPTVATIYFEEFCPAKWDNAKSFWARMPRNQIAKCARAQAIRAAYPDLGGLYIAEEMERIKDEYTPNGRQIIQKATDGTHLGTHGAAQAVLQAKLAGTMPMHPEASIDVPVREAQPKEKPVPKKPDPKPIETKYELTIDWNEDRVTPVLTGDMAELGGLLPKEVVLIWKGDFWRAQAKDIPAIMQVASQNAFLVKEFQPNQVSSAGQQRSAPPAQGRPAATGRGSATPPAAPSAGPEIVTGTIERVQPSSDASCAVVTFVKSTGGKAGWTCFDKDIYGILTNNVGKLATVIIQSRESKGKTYTNLIGLKKVGATEYDDDGKTPVIQRSEQQPRRTLF
jgi:phage recombination protein Bet